MPGFRVLPSLFTPSSDWIAFEHASVKLAANRSMTAPREVSLIGLRRPTLVVMKPAC